MQAVNVAETDFYQDWQASEGIPVVTGFGIENLGAVELGHWPRFGGRGAFINLGTKPSPVTGAYLCEIAPEGHLEPQAHMCEEFIYIVSGRGATTVWNDAGPKRVVEWQQGSFIGIPMNARHQHFNTSTDPARLMSFNNMPTLMNFFRSERFMFDNPFVFADRFADAEADYFGEGEVIPLGETGRRVLKANFVPDLRSLQLYAMENRGAGGVNVAFAMASSQMHTHMSQFPVGTYKKGHVDPRTRGSDPGGGSLLLIVEGVGFTLVWRPGEPLQRLDWQRNGMAIAPAGYYHQHFNTGATPARYLALTSGRSDPLAVRANLSEISEKAGGAQIEYEDENPEIHAIFETELARHGAVCRMSGMSPFCTSAVGVV
jgi:oxalate decarboxylase/phosphoglucose isomerase-like protein (cupin superfamily)